MVRVRCFVVAGRHKLGLVRFFLNESLELELGARVRVRTRARDSR